MPADRTSKTVPQHPSGTTCKALLQVTSRTTQADLRGRGAADGAAYLMQIVDELSQILNGVDVVVGRGGDEGYPRLTAPEVGDVR